MEKIYIEENKQQSSKGLTFSVVLSFVVALFAVFSIGSYGILSLQGGSKVSYAAPTANTFTFTTGKLDNGQQMFVDGYDANGTRTFTVPLYYDENGNPIFCIEHNTNINDGEIYTKSEAINDAGLLYILNNTYVGGKRILDADENEYEAWATQVAIWMYLRSTDQNSRNFLSDADATAIGNTKSLKVRGSLDIAEFEFNSAQGIYASVIDPLLVEAKKQTSVKSLAVTKAGDEVNKTDDGNYYVSQEITVTGQPSSDLKYYSVSLSGIEGIKAIDGEGKELNLNHVDKGTSFYIQIPADKVTTTVQTVQVSVTGYFDMLEGSVFTARDNSNLQKVVTVTGSQTSVNKGIEIEVVGAPDTGMNTAQTIYFIGLIVLLCGVGIVYANAKPVGIKQ